MDLTQLMGDDHRNIMDHFARFFLLANNNNEEALHVLDSLCWELERHLLIEEKEVFLSYPIKGVKDQEMVDRLFKDHREILHMIESIKSKISQNIHVDCSELKTLWIDHEAFERDIFYPTLDTTLSDESKMGIYQKVNTLIEDRSKS